MRSAFTLIELMIVIAIIAIIAAIAIPNLLESRITAQEAAAAAALRSGVLPAEVQFKSGGYADGDNNGIGTYAVDGIILPDFNPYNCMAGKAPLGQNFDIFVNLLPPSFAVVGVGYSSAKGTATTLANPTREHLRLDALHPREQQSGRRHRRRRHERARSELVRSLVDRNPRQRQLSALPALSVIA
jgi:prepilin-type N-terminal cleavage/methylation domain-containing protein